MPELGLPKVGLVSGSQLSHSEEVQGKFWTLSPEKCTSLNSNNPRNQGHYPRAPEERHLFGRRRLMTSSPRAGSQGHVPFEGQGHPPYWTEESEAQ